MFENFMFEDFFNFDFKIIIIIILIFWVDFMSIVLDF